MGCGVDGGGGGCAVFNRTPILPKQYQQGGRCDKHVLSEQQQRQIIKTIMRAVETAAQREQLSGDERGNNDHDDGAYDYSNPQ